MRRFSIGRPASATLVLLVGFGLALWLRVAIGGQGVAQSAWAGLVFAGCLAVLGLAYGTRLRLTRRALAIGLAGGVALCVPAAVMRLVHGAGPVSASGYGRWALVVIIVAAAEEYFLRGSLYDTAQSWLGETFAIIVGAVMFAVLHVPLYGWHVVPLDLAVGLWLGALRLYSGSPTAPATAHVLADLASWWLR